MKKCQWTTIHVNKVVGKKNFWTDVCERFENNGDEIMDFSKVEDLFRVPEPARNGEKAEKADKTVKLDERKKKEVSPR